MRRRHRFPARWVTMIAAVPAGFLLPAPAVAQDPGVSGEWAIEVRGADGTVQPASATLLQDGATVSGSIQVPLMPPTAFTDGVVRDGAMTLTVPVEVEGQTFLVRVTGVVSQDTIRGTIELANYGAFPFVAVRVGPRGF